NKRVKFHQNRKLEERVKISGRPPDPLISFKFTRCEIVPHNHPDFAWPLRYLKKGGVWLASKADKPGVAVPVAPKSPPDYPRNAGWRGCGTAFDLRRSLAKPHSRGGRQSAAAARPGSQDRCLNRSVAADQKEYLL